MAHVPRLCTAFGVVINSHSRVKMQKLFIQLLLFDWHVTPFQLPRTSHFTIWNNVLRRFSCSQFLYRSRVLVVIVVVAVSWIIRWTIWTENFALIETRERASELTTYLIFTEFCFFSVGIFFDVKLFFEWILFVLGKWVELPPAWSFLLLHVDGWKFLEYTHTAVSGLWHIKES